MEFWRPILWAIGGFSVIGAMYGLHRICLYLEDRGLLYYIRTKSSTGAASSMIALQRELEPQTRYVQQMAEERRHYSDDEASGDGKSGTGSTSQSDG